MKYSSSFVPWPCTACTKLSEYKWIIWSQTWETMNKQWKLHIKMHQKWKKKLMRNFFAYQCWFTSEHEYFLIFLELISKYILLHFFLFFFKQMKRGGKRKLTNKIVKYLKILHCPTCMQTSPMDMNFNKRSVNMYFAALWPDLFSKSPVSFFLGHPVVHLSI